MNSDILFTVNSMLLGLGLSADAFSVSLVNGSCIPEMKPRTGLLISGAFAFFQALMPMLGWLITTRLISCFGILQKIIPYVSQLLLLYLGIKIILEGRRESKNCPCPGDISPATLLMQSIATSVDALLAGLALSEYCLSMALWAAFIIAAVTFIICFAGVHMGKLLGTKLMGKAGFFGGSMLILIAAENFCQTVAGLF